MNKINIRLIIGLGNPGKEYENTRHNAGFFFIDEAAKYFKIDNFTIKKNLRSEIAETYCDLTENSTRAKKPIGKRKLILAKPQTFMNKSGEAIIVLSKFYKIKPENILIVHDDIDIFWGDFKFSFGRSSAGHKGAESAIKYLRTKNFWRLRIGIQDPRRAKIKADKVILKKLSIVELNFLNKTIKRSVSELKNHLL